MKKLLVLILLLSLLASLTSCSNIEYDEAEVKSTAVELIRASALLDEILWGRGIEYVEDLNYSNGSYYMASEISLIKYGIRTVADIESLAYATFSARYAKSSLQSVLGVDQSDKDEDDFVYVLVRYYQKYEDAEQNEPVCIMVNSKYEPLLCDEVEYLYDTVKVLGSDREHIYISIDARVTREEKSQINTVNISLVVENGSYKIDTPTYTSYKEAD